MDVREERVVIVLKLADPFPFFQQDTCTLDFGYIPHKTANGSLT